VRVDPDPDLILKLRTEEAYADVACDTLRAFNAWLTERLDREHAIGHSFFLGRDVTLNGRVALDGIWRHHVRPLLEEYFFGDRTALDEAQAKWIEAVRAAEEEHEDEIADEAAG